MESRFGIEVSTFDGYLLFKNNKGWSLLKESSCLAELAPLKISRVGLKAFQRVGAFIKPTTRLIQLFGHKACRGIVDVDGEQLSQLLSEEAFPMDLDLDEGYVILRLTGGMILGLGLYVHGRLRSQLPKKEIRTQQIK